MTNKVYSAADLWEVLESFPTQQMEMAKERWVILEKGLEGWK
jgi:hypothetical protein